MDLVLVSEILPNYKQDRERWAVHRCDLHPNARANALLARYLKDWALRDKSAISARVLRLHTPKYAPLHALEKPRFIIANPRIREEKSQTGCENADSLESTFQQSPTTQKVKSGF